MIAQKPCGRKSIQKKAGPEGPALQYGRYGFTASKCILLRMWPQIGLSAKRTVRSLWRNLLRMQAHKA